MQKTWNFGDEDRCNLKFHHDVDNFLDEDVDNLFSRWKWHNCEQTYKNEIKLGDIILLQLRQSNILPH